MPPGVGKKKPKRIKIKQLHKIMQEIILDFGVLGFQAFSHSSVLGETGDSQIHCQNVPAFNTFAYILLLDTFLRVIEGRIQESSLF